MKRSLELKLSKWGTKTAIKPYLLSLHVLLVNLKLPFLIYNVSAGMKQLDGVSVRKMSGGGCRRGSGMLLCHLMKRDMLM